MPFCLAFFFFLPFFSLPFLLSFSLPSFPYFLFLSFLFFVLSIFLSYFLAFFFLSFFLPFLLSFFCLSYSSSCSSSFCFGDSNSSSKTIAFRKNYPHMVHYHHQLIIYTILNRCHIWISSVIDFPWRLHTPYCPCQLLVTVGWLLTNKSRSQSLGLLLLIDLCQADRLVRYWPNPRLCVSPFWRNICC